MHLFSVLFSAKTKIAHSHYRLHFEINNAALLMSGSSSLHTRTFILA